MRSTVLVPLALLLAVGCDNTALMSDHRANDMGSGSDIGGVPIPACPVDPDCASAGTCAQYECPDYWICEDTPVGGKRCTNPGPDYPDGGTWECEDIGGVTVCRGTSFPDDGGGSEWNCEMQAEFVVCTSNNPDYPDGGGDSVWDCYFSGEFRICESGGGDGGGWSCYDTVSGRECRHDSPGYPDDRMWECWDEAGATVCRSPGSDLPDGGSDGGWYCEISGEFVVCRDDSPEYPDGGGDSAWDCTFSGEFRICSGDFGDGGGSGGGGGGGGDGGGTVCVPGTQRWCDDAIYCSWGKQTCLPDGRWGACIEPTVTRSGLSDRPATECGCRYFYFNEACCEDQADRDGDGHADCIIPAGHTPPTCASSGGLCSYCDSHEDCGGPADLCVFRRDGYALCGRDCSTTGCPSGYSCVEISTPSGTARQCAPAGGLCG